MTDYSNEKMVYVNALKGQEAYHYRFTCPDCQSTFILATGRGRFGKLGPFMCNKCNEMYVAFIDDFRFPRLYVERASTRRSKDDPVIPIVTLKELDGKS